MSDDLTPSELNMMAFAVRDGTAEPEEAERLLQLFCQCVEHSHISARNPVADRLLEHIREAFRAHLSNPEEVSIEYALGLVKSKGRPKGDQARRILMATAVLRRRLSGMTHQEALEEVSKELGAAESIIGNAWKAHRQDALFTLRQDREQGVSPWTPAEKKRLSVIYKKADWFIAPGKSGI